LLSLLGRRAEEQKRHPVKTPELHGLMKERLRWYDPPGLRGGVGTEPSAVLQPGKSSCVAPLTKAQQRRMKQKSDNAAWKNRHIHQPSGLTPYDDHRTSIGGTEMIAQMPHQPQPPPQQPHSARGVAGELDPMGRRGTAAAARLGGGSYSARELGRTTNQHQHQALKPVQSGLAAEMQAIAEIRELGGGGGSHHHHHATALGGGPHQQQQHVQDVEPFVLTKKNKIFGPIRAPSPPRLPLPVPQHMAHPERGLIDVFPDGTRIAGRINRRMERRMMTRG